MEIPKNTTTKEILEAINEWSRYANRLEVRNMWNILTGLRGPDNDDIKLKHATTIYIRSAVLHNLTEYAHADSVWYDEKKQEIFKVLGELASHKFNFQKFEDTDHFKAHLNYAAQSILQIQGDNVNKYEA